jgi:hypothetical protein
MKQLLNSLLFGKQTHEKQSTYEAYQQTVIANKQKKTYSCVNCLFDLKRHGRAAYCNYPKCHRYGLLTVLGYENGEVEVKVKQVK